MYCKMCGKQLKDGVKFCTNCGNPVTYRATPSMPDAISDETLKPEKPEEPKEKVIEADKTSAERMEIVNGELVDIKDEFPMESEVDINNENSTQLTIDIASEPVGISQINSAQKVDIIQNDTEGLQANAGREPNIRQENFIKPQADIKREVDIKSPDEGKSHAGVKPQKSYDTKSRHKERDTAGREKKKTEKDANARLLTVMLILVLGFLIAAGAAVAVYLYTTGAFENSSSVQRYESRTEDDDEDAEEDDSDSGLNDEDDSKEDSDDVIIMDEGGDTAVPDDTGAGDVLTFSDSEETETEEAAEEAEIFEDLDIDIDAECSEITSTAQDYKNTMGNYDHEQLADGQVNAYVYGGEPLVIEVNSGFNGWNCDRTYYGIDSYYTVLDDHDANAVYELFYSGGKLIRCVENGEVHDYNSENWAFYNDIGVKAAEEKQSIRNYV